MKCTICKMKFIGSGNNPAPVKFSGRCCDKCNYELVVPMRIISLTKRQINQKNDM